MWYSRTPLPHSASNETSTVQRAPPLDERASRRWRAGKIPFPQIRSRRAAVKLFDKIPRSLVRVFGNSSHVLLEEGGKQKAGGLRRVHSWERIFFLFFFILHVFSEGPAGPHPSQHTHWSNISLSPQNPTEQPIMRTQTRTWCTLNCLDSPAEKLLKPARSRSETS